MLLLLLLFFFFLLCLFSWIAALAAVCCCCCSYCVSSRGLLHSPQFVVVVVVRNPAMLGPEAVKNFLLPRLLQFFSPEEVAQTTHRYCWELTSQKHKSVLCHENINNRYALD
jgi:hypothetical protein